MPKRPARPKADAGRRATRSAFQGGLVALLIMIINAFVNPDLTTEQVGVISVVALPVFSYLQNMLEEVGAVPEMLKGATVPAPGPPPADDLTRRELNALAEAIGELKLEMHELKAERGLAENPARISTRQLEPEGVSFRG